MVMMDPNCLLYLKVDLIMCYPIVLPIFKVHPAIRLRAEYLVFIGPAKSEIINHIYSPGLFQPIYISTMERLSEKEGGLWIDLPVQNLKWTNTHACMR